MSNHHNVVSINLHPRRLPQGSLAWHREHGCCDILAASGEMRKIRWMDVIADDELNVSDLPISIDSKDVIVSETICVCIDEVNAEELVALDARGEAQNYRASLHELISAMRIPS